MSKTAAKTILVLTISLLLGLGQMLFAAGGVTASGVANLQPVPCADCGAGCTCCLVPAPAQSLPSAVPVVPNVRTDAPLFCAVVVPAWKFDSPRLAFFSPHFLTADGAHSIALFKQNCRYLL